MRLSAIDRGPHAAAPAIGGRVSALPWGEAAASLDERGYATTGPLLTAQECAALIALYGEAARFRSRVVMERHGFGRGEYQYFAYPLPDLVGALRQALYVRLAPVANRWGAVSQTAAEYPRTLDDYLARCHAAGQARPTPLLLRYGTGDFNCLHRDLYGPLVFPLQVTVLLSEPERDFAGGEFLLVEQRPRAQSRAEVVALSRGEAVVFAVNQRPARGARGVYRVAMRHGVSRVRQGKRYALGIIFHDAA
jgi:hypothetical protein